MYAHHCTVLPKYIVTVEVEPLDEADYDAWYREEHLDALHKIPVYRRSQRYKLGARATGDTTSEPPRYLAMHEVDDVSQFFKGPEFNAAWSDWTRKQMKEAKLFRVRAWEKIKEIGR